MTLQPHSFTESFKANFKRALPSGAQCVTWHRDDTGDEFAVITPCETSFILSARCGEVAITSLRNGAEQDLGESPGEDRFVEDFICSITETWDAEVAETDALWQAAAPQALQGATL